MSNPPMQYYTTTFATPCTAVRPSHGIIHPSEPRLHPYVRAVAKPSAPNNPISYQQIPNPPIQTRKPTNTTAPIIVPQCLDIIKRKKDDND